MFLPVDWLRDYVAIDVDVDQLAHDLTMFGTKIEGMEVVGPDFTGVYVGKVLERQKHPNADRLSLCRVEVGGEKLDIVCGAPNVRQGLTVAVAKVGAKLPGDFKIRKTKIRGQVSQGMICSSRELGLGDEHDGILELDEQLQSGTDFQEVVGRGQMVLEAEVTPNRPDCLALFGLAREVAALYEKPLKTPEVWQGAVEAEAKIEIEIEDPADCGRYFGRVLRGVRVEPSPEWLQARLRAMGSEPINNVVDVTNYVLFETGQPLHAFDLNKVTNAQIIVRRARKGEKLTTLDGVVRQLDADILVIADARKPVAIAGVMGGLESAVQEGTTDLLLESAFFRPDLVRAGRRKLGLDTDASYRFERTADIEAARWAADRATALFIEICGASVEERDVDAYPKPYKTREVSLRLSRANQLVGTHLTADQARRHLERLQLDSRVDKERLLVNVPAFRRDLVAEIDLIEELARLHGYDNIPDDAVPPAPLRPQANELDDFMALLRRKFVERGFFEIRTSAFMDRRDPDRLTLEASDPRRRFVPVRNPLITTLDTMRTTLLPGALRVLRHNLNFGQQDLRLVQIDRVFRNEAGDYPGLPREDEKLQALVCGNAYPAHWSEKARAYDIYDLKGEVQALLEDLCVDSVWTYGYTDPTLRSETSFLISGSYGDLGFGGELRAEVLDRYDVKAAVFLFEFDLSSLRKQQPTLRRAQEIPRFPAVKRDLSLVVPAAVRYEQIRSAVQESGGKLLESVQCFDLFEDDSLVEGSRSIGLRLRFRSSERTLSDSAVDPTIESILSKLRESLEVHLRAG